MRATDRRTVRTVAAIETAVRAALGEVALDELTVAEVCRRAGIGRPSFYTHFASVPAVVAQMLTAEIDDELPVNDLDAVDPEAIEPAITMNFAAALQIVVRDRDLYRAAYASTSSGVLRRVLEKAIETRVRNIILIWLELGLVDDVDMEVAVPFAAGGIATALESWAFDDSTDAAGRARAIRDQMPRWWPFPE